MNNTKIKTAGLPPGSLVHLGDHREHTVNIYALDYNLEVCREFDQVKLDQLAQFTDKSTVTWINVDGVHDIDTVEVLGRQFKLHPLVLEDIVNTHHRPKVEEFDNSLFFTFKMLSINAEEQEIESEQVSIILAQGYVISFQEIPGDVFDPVRNRIKAGKGRIRKRGSDYLVYALVDTVVDSYFAVIDRLEYWITDLETRVEKTPTSELFSEIQDRKNQLIALRQAIIPLKDAVGYLVKGESDLIDERIHRYLNDVYDHIIHISDAIELQREILGGIRETYNTGISNQLNQVMKVLTIIATIFIPLTFIAGIYGMNFQFMPELAWKWAYPAIWGIMLALAFGMLVFFRRKKWL